MLYSRILVRDWYGYTISHVVGPKCEYDERRLRIYQNEYRSSVERESTVDCEQLQLTV